jgi:Flp pilus assembly pilin Flp
LRVGPTAVECAVMLALIIVVCLTAIQAVGTFLPAGEFGHAGRFSRNLIPFRGHAKKGPGLLKNGWVVTVQGQLVLIS